MCLKCANNVNCTSCVLSTTTAPYFRVVDANCVSDSTCTTWGGYIRGTSSTTDPFQCIGKVAYVTFILNYTTLACNSNCQQCLSTATNCTTCVTTSIVKYLGASTTLNEKWVCLGFNVFYIWTFSSQKMPRSMRNKSIRRSKQRLSKYVF
jgi:hypothetical protein